MTLHFACHFLFRMLKTILRYLWMNFNNSKEKGRKWIACVIWLFVYYPSTSNDERKMGSQRRVKFNFKINSDDKFNTNRISQAKKSVAKWEMGFIYYVINKGGESLFCTVWRRKGKFLSLLSFHLTVEQNHRTEQHVESEFFRQQRRLISGSFRASSVISANLKWPPVPSTCVVGRHQSSVSGSPWQRLHSYKYRIYTVLY